MSSLADFPELVGFFSYSREDDDDSEGALSRLRDRIQRELAAQLGRSRADFRLWQDKAAIPHGALWEGEIASAIAQSVFFIPIITPRAIKSTHCAFEFDSFLRREAELGRADLVFPILYIPVPALEDERLWRLDPILKVVGTRQYLDWHTARHRSFADSAVAEKVEYFCRNISRALRKPWTAPNQPEREKTVGPTREVDVQDRLSRAKAEEGPLGARKITRFARVGFIAGAAALGIFGTAALYWHNRSAEQTPPVSVSPAPQTPSLPAEVQPTADFKAALARKSYVEAFGLARPAAEHGDREAQFILGWLYYNGRGVDPSDDMAAAWFQKAARQNHLFAQLNLADMYEAGVGVPRSNEEAFYWYRRAADQGNADAQNRLGIAYAQGLGTQRDDGQAFMWYQKAAEQKYARALKNLGDMWFAGRGVPRADANEALKYYKQAAEQNFGPAEFNIGYLYETGFEGQQRDPQKAVEWYNRATAHGSAPAKDALTRLHIDSPAASDNEAKKDSAKSIFALAQSAAESGDRDAQYTLASLYLTGDKDQGIERDEAKAATWYQKAAEQGHRSAQAKLGGMYEEGSGVQRSYAQAFTWYRKAADQGDPEAQNNLGSLYARGLGTDRDDAAAVSWYQKAVKEAYAAAQKNLADMYAAGRGVQRDDREALRLYKLAADQEDADAEDKLGHFFENGLGGAQRDYQEAFKWYCKALDDGSDDAEKHVDALRKKARIKDKCDTGGGPVINFGGFRVRIGGNGYRAHRSKGD